MALPAAVEAVTNGQEGNADWANSVQALINALRTAVTSLLAPAACRARQIVAQSIANNTWVALTMTAEDLDTAGGHSTSVNTSRYTAVTAGTYLVTGGSSWVNNVTGVRGARIAKNGTGINGSEAVVGAAPSSGNRVAAKTILVALAIGDYVEIEALQTSGGALNTVATSSDQSDMTVLRVSD